MSWSAAQELAFYEALDADVRVAGLELPWLGGLHPHDESWLLQNYPPRFSAVLTGIPGLMRTLAKHPDYGLASVDDEGRRAAVAEVGRIGDAVRRWHDMAGRRIVEVVELHSGPRRERASEVALARSLDEVAGLDLAEAAVVIEHCDAAIAGQRAEKGFLPLDAELRALAGAPAEWGVSLNWGRSAIELRGAERVHEHAAAASASGRLRGLMFSGASAAPSPFGDAWVDAHLPFHGELPGGIPESLLTEAAAAATVRAAGDVRWCGLKTGCADSGASVAQRVAGIRSGLDVLERVVADVARGADLESAPVSLG